MRERPGSRIIGGVARRQGGCSRGQALEPRGSRSSSPWCWTRTESGDTRVRSWLQAREGGGCGLLVIWVARKSRELVGGYSWRG